ncbi:lantibiotic dehydratase [Amycolatopsis sp. lyj-23]|uniref:lantibiotic dehydratase n=1 Tax=Amycolatopsis sp. lyj-23 TaxID=2789283 RepID=UPI003979E698
MTTDAVPTPEIGDWGLWPTMMLRGAGFPVNGVALLADPDLASLADTATEDASTYNSEAYADAWQRTSELLSGEVAGIARSSQFRLAVTWQNPRFLATGVAPYLRGLAGDRAASSRQRAREQTIAAYWQRYCLKNESIGFFGPVSWAGIDMRHTASVITAGSKLTEDAVVHLERWPVELLARRIEAMSDLRPWLRPRRSPLVYVGAEEVRLASGHTVVVDELGRRMLSLADGTRTAAELARQLIGVAGTGSLDEQAVYGKLEELRRRRLVIWRLELAVSSAPEQELMAVVERIDDPALRESAMRQVCALVDARARLQAVWDRPDELLDELACLERIHVEQTGAPATRNDGQAYGGRTLAFLDCRRDLSARMGSSFVDALRPLEPVLDSVRWLTWRIGELLRPRLHEAYLRAQHAAGAKSGAQVDAAAFWTTCMTMFGASLGTLVSEALEEFHERWYTMVPLGDGQHQVDLRLEQIASSVQELFAAPASGWDQARMVCPDVMLVAANVQDVEHGRFTLVLGEVHAAMISLDYLTLVARHRDAAELEQCVDLAFPGPRLLPVLPPESRPQFTARSHPALIRDADQRITLVPQTPPPGHGQIVLGADAEVREHDGALWVVCPDGTEFPAVDLFGEVVKSQLLRRFEILPIDGHRPRITIDGAVISREGWEVRATGLDFARQRDPAQRFAQARAWARRLGLPRQVFVKVPGETKPTFVDFASPVFVDVLATSTRRVVRNAAPSANPVLKLTEMLPSTDQTWLPGPEGETYTCEFRLACYDRRVSPPSTPV